MLEKTVAEIKGLMSVAMACLEAGEIDRLAWRLADAGGLTRKALNESKPEATIIGKDDVTGRGYMLPGAAGVVEVEVRSVYGNNTIYPANYEAERFAALAGKKTLSPTDLANIKALGFLVKEIAVKKLAA